MKKIFILSQLLFIQIFVSAQMTPTFDDITIQMRDGEFLEADVYLPSDPGPFEAILIQTPYNKDMFEFSLPMGVQQNVNGQPFAWVIVDWRGFYGSAGAAAGSGNRGEDGYDFCEWIVAQSWHGDRIGTWGPSALGKIQYDTAEEHHPNHTCAVPLVAHPQFSYDDYFYGGVLEESRLQQLDALGYGLSPIVLANVYYSNTWIFAENASWNPDLIEIPMLQIGGWYDQNIDKMMDWYAATRNNAAVSVQDQQWLLVGPWVHGGTGTAYVGSSLQGELTYPNAEFKSDTMAWNFLNYYLLDAPNSWDTTSMITYYETGKDVWRTSNSSTIEASTDDVLYLNNGGALINTLGNGTTSFVCDPSDPSPTLGGPTLSTGLDQGPYDQISLISRSDVVAFETLPLGDEVNVSGRITATIFVSSDQPDGDIAIRLVDEYPDGRNMLVTDGIRRIRFRNGYTQADESFMTPGQIYQVEITLPFTNYTWKVGHKIKILISGNNATRWDINLQDGGTMYQPGTGNVANLTIHHDGVSPSTITLPGNNPVLATNELDELSVEVFPNPFAESISIKSKSVIDRISILDIYGREIIETNSLQLDLSELSRGSYLVKIKSGIKIATRKIMKK
jgi:predicted acyl esterase